LGVVSLGLVLGWGTTLAAQTAPSSSPSDLTNPATDVGEAPPEMIGDLPPLPVVVPPSTPGGKPAVLPSARGLKVADNQSPDTLDRVYLSFNYFDNLYGASNRSLGSDVRNPRVFQETFGLEKACLDGIASVGLSLPLNSLTLEPGRTSLVSNSTDVGDLSVIFKTVLFRSEEGGSLISAGLAVTIPTGPTSFAANGEGHTHGTSLQPFVGYLCGHGSAYVQGFSAIDASTSGDPTLLFNDVGVGYYVYRSPEPRRFLSALVPTLELHVTTPLSGRGGPDPTAPTRVPDFADVTAGLQVQFFGKSWLAIGFLGPLTGPRPFDYEVVAQFRCRF
jgi:hypothetical protein